METAKKLFARAAAEGKTRKPFLQLGKKLESGGVEPTGKHIVKIIEGKLGKGTDPFTNQPRDEFQVIVEEKGVEKMWNIPVKDKDGNLHYLVQRLAEVDEGATISLEMKKKGMKNYIELLVGTKGEEIPTINLDEDSEAALGGGDGMAPEPDISPEDVPF